MTQSFDEALRCFAPALPLAVGLSGGADSTALLLACAARWPGQVQAIHVHHGLQAAADGFERHCTALCARLQVPLQVLDVVQEQLGQKSPLAPCHRSTHSASHCQTPSSYGSARWPLLSRADRPW